MIKMIMAHYGIIWSNIYHLVGRDVNSNNANEVTIILG